MGLHGNTHPNELVQLSGIVACIHGHCLSACLLPGKALGNVVTTRRTRQIQEGTSALPLIVSDYRWKARPPARKPPHDMSGATTVLGPDDSGDDGDSRDCIFFTKPP
jgi:hypothetical protein